MRRKLPDGVWQRINIQSVPPRPLFAEDLTEAAANVLPETAFGLLAALTSVTLGGLAVGVRAGDRSFRRWRLITWTLVTILGGSAAIVVVWFGVLLITMIVNLNLRYPMPGEAPTVLVALLGYTFTILVFRWRLVRLAQVATLAPERRPAFICTGLLVAAAIALMTPLPWIPWALGTIPDYSTALILAVMLDCLILVAGYRRALHKVLAGMPAIRPPEV
jgi:Ca2+/Na+ antiporter